MREAIANEEKARQDLENARRTAELTARLRSGALGVRGLMRMIMRIHGSVVKPLLA